MNASFTADQNIKLNSMSCSLNKCYEQGLLGKEEHQVLVAWVISMEKEGSESINQYSVFNKSSGNLLGNL